MTPTDPNAGRSITEPEDGRAAMVLEGLLIGIVSNRKADLGGCTERDKAQCGCSECLATAALVKLGDMVTERRALAERLQEATDALSQVGITAGDDGIWWVEADPGPAECCSLQEALLTLASLRDKDAEQQARAALRPGAPSEEGE